MGKIRKKKLQPLIAEKAARDVDHVVGVKHQTSFDDQA